LKINYEKLHELSFLNRENLYKEKENINFNYFSKRLGEIENDPFIGFVGSKYAEVKVRVLFLGKSNAASAPKDQNKDIQINQYLRNFRDSSENLENRYRDYAKQYSDKSSGAFRAWKINRYSVYFRGILGLDIEETAYANIVPFRYEDAPENRSVYEGRKIYEIAFNNFTNKLISIIKPHLIIPLGANLKKYSIDRFIDSRESEIKVSDGISRTRGDLRISELGKETLNNAIEDYEALFAGN